MRAMYTMDYHQRDYGTERILTVRQDGREIGQCDPFPAGIPVDPKTHKRQLLAAAQRIIDQHKNQEH